MPQFVYLLCSLTGIACAWLLIRSYLENRTRIALWSSLCFTGLGASNALLFVDLVLLPTEVDLALTRAVLTLVSLSVLVLGLVWDAR